MKHTILLLLLLLVPSCLFAQQLNCNHRTIPVSVLDGKDVPVAGLTAENFRGSFRGAPVKIVSAKIDVRPRRLVILLDLSGSMSRGRKLEFAQFIVAHALASTPIGSQVALITFGDKPEIRAGLLQDKLAVTDLVRDINRIDRKSTKGRTALWDAVGVAVNLLSPPQPGDVVYAVTEGDENASHLRRLDAAKALLESGIRFFAFLVPSEVVRVSYGANPSSPQDLEEVAEMTGGKALNVLPASPFAPTVEFNLSPKGQQNISDAASQLYLRMQQIYLVEVELTKEVDKPRSWKLELVPNSQGPVKGLSLHYPRKLFPCSAAKDTQQPTPE